MTDLGEGVQRCQLPGLQGTARRVTPATAVALVTLALALASCAAGQVTGPAGQPIIGARSLPDDPDAIEVEFSGCDDAPAVDVFESESTVRVTLEGPNAGCEPIYEMVVELDEPLGDRTLVDGATGSEVAVAPE